MPVRVLLTGFQPFDGLASNPSWAAARAVAPGGVAVGSTREEPAVSVSAGLLPVDFRRAPQVLAELVAAHRPDAWNGLGVAVGRAQVCLERVGLNLMDARIPDAAGWSPVDQPIRPAGPAARFSTLPDRAVLAAWERESLPGRLSLTAGAYVCNRVLYEGLDMAAAWGLHAAGFHHLPATAEALALTPENAPEKTPQTTPGTTPEASASGASSGESTGRGSAGASGGPGAARGKGPASVGELPPVLDQEVLDRAVALAVRETAAALAAEAAEISS